MPDISHQTKITIGLGVTMASVVFAAGYFYAKQESMSQRVSTLESERPQIVQMREDVAVIKTKLEGMDTRLSSAIVRWDKHIDSNIKY